MSTPLILPSPRIEGFGYHSRILFHWRADRMRITALGGEQPTFARAGDAAVMDSVGKIRTVGYNQTRWTGWDTNSDGVADLPALLLERATPSGGNLVGASEAIQADAVRWTRDLTPTFGTPHTASGINLDLVGDDNVTDIEKVIQTITYTGDGVKALRVRVKKGTSPAASGSRFIVYDTTAPAFRLSCLLTWNADGTLITPTCSPGVLIGVVRRYDFCYDVLLQTSAVTAANTNQVRINPAQVNTEMGNLYVGGVQAENATTPSSYVKNAADPGGTRIADVLSWPFLALPQAMSLYVQFVEQGTIGLANARVLTIGSDSLANPYLFIFSTGTYYKAEYHNGSVAVSATLAVAPTVGSRVELRVVLNANGSITIAQALNDGAEGTAVTSSPPASGPAIPAAWSDTKLWLNGEAAAVAGLGLYRAVKAAAGVRTLEDLRTRAF